MFKKSLFIIFIILLISFSFADLGPKPEVNFNVTYESKSLNFNIFGRLLEKTSCDINAISFENYSNLFIQELSTNPRGLVSSTSFERDSKYLTFKKFNDNNICWKIAQFAWGGNTNDEKLTFGYHPPEEFRLFVIGYNNLSIKSIFLSNSIKKSYFVSNYSANLKENGVIELTDVSNLYYFTSLEFIVFIRAFFITIILELIFAFILFRKNILINKFLLSIFIGNVITLPFVWFVFPKIFLISDVFVFLFYELFAIVVETIIIYLMNKTELNYKTAFNISLILNILSVIIGSIIMFITYIFLGF
ncbi:MAG: hypothetical protein PHQ98_02280 [Candidatus ainarchaeum sp.]|nr:hypothetical protein [Candidatus ainarchaeum sp.]